MTDNNSNTDNSNNNTDNSNNNTDNNSNSNTDNSNTEFNIEYTYICIKKQYFNVKLIDLNYSNIKTKQYIDIIYKSPSIYLDGIFLKTPPINISLINVLTKYNKYSNNIIIKINLDSKDAEHEAFINMMKSIDDYIYKSILKCSTYINNELCNTNNNSFGNTYYNNNISFKNNTQIWDKDIYDISYYKYDNIIKQQRNYWEINMKSYIDAKSIVNLYKNQHTNSKYVFTFNITNIYCSNINLLPLVKCNKCDLHL